MSPSTPHRRARSQTTVPHWCNNSGVNSTPSLPGTPCQTVLRVNQSNVGVGFGPSVHAPLEGFLLQQQGGPFSSPCGADRRRRCLAPDPAARPGAEAAVLPPAPAARPGEGAPRLPPTNAAQPREEAAALPPAPAARPGEGARGRNVRPGASLVVPAGAARCLPQAGDGFLARRLAARLVARRECTPRNTTGPHWRSSANAVPNQRQRSAKPEANPVPNPRKTTVSFGRPHAGASHFWRGVWIWCPKM